MQQGSWKLAPFLFTVAALAAGCSGRTLFVGNILLAAVPCVMMYLTLNLKK